MDALTLKELYESQLREELKCPPTPDFNRREMSCMGRYTGTTMPEHGSGRTSTWVTPKPSKPSADPSGRLTR